MKPEYFDSIDFLKRFHPGRRWVLTAISLDKRSISTATFDEKRVNPCIEWLEKFGADRNIYFSVGEVSRDVDKKAERTDINNVWWLHVDVDPRAGEDIKAEQERALKLLKNPPGLLPPTCIVYSGGGYQAFWKLKSPIQTNNSLELAEDAKLYNLHIEVALGADNVHDISRIMRLPGTVNRPDALKVKKGRVPALAVLESWNDDNVYNIEQFTKAPLVQSSGAIGGGAGRSAPAVNVSGNVRRLTSIDELPDKVSGRAKVIICQGFDPDDATKFSGRSEWLFYVCCELVRGGCDDDTIYSVITDPQFAISSSVLDKGSMTDAYAKRQISRAKEDAIDPHLRQMNEQFAVIRNWSGKCRIVEEQYDEVMGRFRLTKQSFDDFKNGHMNIRKVIGQNSKGDDITKGLGEWWLFHPNRRQFDKLIFAPGREVPDAYNLWRGFAVDSKPGDCSLFLSHVEKNICAGNKDYFHYLIHWMACSVQRPDSPGHSGVVFKGGQGTGKSFVAKTLGSLFGRHFMQVTDPKHLVGSFNAHLRDTVILFGDEAFYAGDKKHESILKMLITEEMITIEAKGVDAEVSGNCIHLMMASNESWVVPAGMDDRRFFVLEVGDDNKNDSKYFQAIVDQLNSGGRSALLHHLLSMDLKGFNVRDVPKTRALQQQKLFSMGSQESWWYEKLKDGRLMHEHNDWRTEMLTYDLHEDYVSFCRQFNVARRGTAYALKTTLDTFIPGGMVEKFQTSTPVEATIDGMKKMVNRPYFYRLPSLDECRAHWDKKFGGPYEWSKPKTDTLSAANTTPTPF